MMTKEQIITGLIDCLEQRLHGGMGHLHEKYYKGEFFHLFTEAYNHGFIADKSLTGSSLWDIIGERWIPPAIEQGVAPQLTVVTRTIARSGVAAPVRDVHAAWVVPSETAAHETTAVRASSSNGP